MSFWPNQRVVVTGGAGFLGSFVVDGLKARGCTEVFAPRSEEYDLRDRSAIARLFQDARPTMVLHLAAVVGGIGANREHPGQFFYENAIMGIELIEQARQLRSAETRRGRHHLRLSEVHARAVQGREPMERLSRGDQCAVWHRQESAACPVPGLPPGVRPQCHLSPACEPLRPARKLRSRAPRTLSPRSSRSAWMPASAAPRSSNVGGPARPTREFLYVEDAADGILLAAEHYNKPDPVNLGSGKEISIKDLVELIVRLTNYKGEIRWDPDPTRWPTPPLPRHPAGRTRIWVPRPDAVRGRSP